MATVLDSLRGISAYPVPLRTLTAAAERRGVSLDAEATQQTLSGSACRLATADLLLWLSEAPNVSQGGQSYSFSEEQRAWFRSRAKSIYAEEGESKSSGTVYGYKGSRL